MALTLLVFAYMFIGQLGNEYSRIMLIAFFPMDTIMMYLGHIIWKYALRKKGKWEVSEQKILIVTTPEFAEQAVNKITTGPDKKYKIAGIGFTEETDIREVMGVPVVAHGKEIYEFACRNVVDGVFLYISLSDQEKQKNTQTAFWRWVLQYILTWNF